MNIFKKVKKERWLRLDHGIFPGETYDFKNKHSLFDIDNCPLKDTNFIRLISIMENI